MSTGWIYELFNDTINKKAIIKWNNCSQFRQIFFFVCVYLCKLVRERCVRSVIPTSKVIFIKINSYFLHIRIIIQHFSFLILKRFYFGMEYNRTHELCVYCEVCGTYISFYMRRLNYIQYTQL